MKRMMVFCLSVVLAVQAMAGQRPKVPADQLAKIQAAAPKQARV